MERKQDASVKRVEDGAYSSRGNTLNAQNCPEVTIGLSENADYTHTNVAVNSKEHIKGINYPMYGLTTLDYPEGVARTENPKVRMKHLSALVAIKVVNQGDAPRNDLNANKDNQEKQIIINELTFAVPTINTVDANKKPVKQAAIPIVGAFNVDITDHVTAQSYSPVMGKTSTSVTLSLPQSVTIDPGKDATFYLAVRPFDATNNKTELSFTNKSAITLDITINGSKRSVEVPADTKFEAGKVTTLRVPVKLSYPKESDVISNTNFLTFNNKKDVTLSVNGEQVSGYSLEKTKKSWSGTTYEQATLTVSGTAADLINALPAGFYASTYNGKRAAMTVTNINLHIPEYDTEGNIIKHTQIASYEPFINKVKEIVVPIIDNILGNGEEWWNGKTIWIIVPITISVRDLFVEIFKNGIPRDQDPLYFTKFIDPQTITFNGIVENGSASSSDNIFILDEEPIYKGITPSQVENLLLTKFSSNGYTASFKGIKDIVNKDYTTDANNTAQAIWGKLQEEIGTMEIPLYDEVKIGVWDVFTAIFPDVTAMKTMLGDLKADITIGSYPYAADKTEYGSKAGGSLVPNKPYNPIIFWGLDVYGTDLSEPR